MQIWPAIDLRGGRCVRLQQGDYARETVYAEDPVEVARQFQQQGARHLHVVDLDGARAGSPEHLELVAKIVEAVDLQCELGGGIRDELAIAAALATGVSRVVIGTAALKRPDWFRAMTEAFPGRLVLGVDARDGKAAVEGWLETSDVSAIDLVRQFDDLPLAAIVYTDIATDGMLQGPNTAAMRAMQQAAPCDVIASGGVTTATDVVHLAEAGLAGAIVGRALYAGTLTLTDALQAARDSAAGADNAKSSGASSQPSETPSRD